MSYLNYCDALKKFELENLYAELGESPGPVLVRVDINVPVNKDTRRISRNPYNLRLENYSYAIDLYSSLAPVVVMAHQGRNDGKDINFIDLRDHAIALGTMMHNGRVMYEREIEGEDYFSRRLAKEIKSLEKGDVLLLENVRKFDFEEKFDAQTCPYIPFFKKAGIEACINDGLPVWHRANASAMALPYIAPTHIGLISAKELETQHKIMHDSGKKTIIIGGMKPKFAAIPKLAEKMDILTGGLTGQMVCKLKGYDLGNKNNEFLEKTYKQNEIEMLRPIVNKYEIATPIDFVASINGDDKIVSVDELKGTDYFINDIGPSTVDKYATDIAEGSYDWKIRGGPNGRYEWGYNNGVKLIRRILGSGFVAVGGDTVEELQNAGLCKPIAATGGHVLLGGGAHLDGWAGEPYPSIEEIIKIQV